MTRVLFRIEASPAMYTIFFTNSSFTDANRWDEKSGLQRDALNSQVIDALEAQEIKEFGMVPKLRTSPSGSATATAIVSHGHPNLKILSSPS